MHISGKRSRADRSLKGGEARDKLRARTQRYRLASSSPSERPLSAKVQAQPPCEQTRRKQESLRTRANEAHSTKNQRSPQPCRMNHCSVGRTETCIAPPHASAARAAARMKSGVEGEGTSEEARRRESATRRNQDNARLPCTRAVGRPRASQPRGTNF